MTGNDLAAAVRTAAELLLLEEVEYSLGLDRDHLDNYRVEMKQVDRLALADALTAGGKFIRAVEGSDHLFYVDFNVSEEDAEAKLDADIEAHRGRSATLFALAGWLADNYGEKVIPWLAPNESTRPTS